MLASLLNEGAPTGGDLLVEQGAVPAVVQQWTPAKGSNSEPAGFAVQYLGRHPQCSPAGTTTGCHHDGLKGDALAPIPSRVRSGQDGVPRKGPSAGRLERGMREPKVAAAGAR